MTHQDIAATAAAVRVTCAKRQYEQAPCPDNTETFPPTSGWSLLAAVTRLRKDLRLTTNDIGAFRALLTFLAAKDAEGKDIAVTSATMTVVFASNQEISKRAHGMDDRVLRSAFQRLARAGLIARRDSANGKRFPIRRGGKIIAAFGLDLRPAFIQAEELFRRARASDETQQECRGLKAEIRALRKTALEHGHRFAADLHAWLVDLGRVLRRKLPVEDLSKIRSEVKALLVKSEEQPQNHCEVHEPAMEQGATCPDLEGHDKTVHAPCPVNRSVEPSRDGCERQELPGHLEDASTRNVVIPAQADTPTSTGGSPACRTSESSGTDGGKCRHIESDKIDINKEAYVDRGTLLSCWARCSELSSFFSEAPTSLSTLREIIFKFTSMMNLKPEQVASGIAQIGWLGMLQACEYLAKNAVKITNPSGYLARMLEDQKSGRRVGWLR